MGATLTEVDFEPETVELLLGPVWLLEDAIEKSCYFSGGRILNLHVLIKKLIFGEACIEVGSCIFGNKK